MILPCIIEAWPGYSGGVAYAVTNPLTEFPKGSVPKHDIKLFPSREEEVCTSTHVFRMSHLCYKRK